MSLFNLCNLDWLRSRWQLKVLEIRWLYNWVQHCNWSQGLWVIDYGIFALMFQQEVVFKGGYAVRNEIFNSIFDCNFVLNNHGSNYDLWFAWRMRFCPKLFVSVHLFFVAFGHHQACALSTFYSTFFYWNLSKVLVRFAYFRASLKSRFGGRNCCKVTEAINLLNVEVCWGLA